MTDAPIIHWFRRDLRLNDNTALRAALDTGAPVIPLFIFDPAVLNSPRYSELRMAFLMRALDSLDEALKRRSSRLIIRSGRPETVLRELVVETGASALYYNRDYTPYACRRDTRVGEALSIDIQAFDDAVLLPPGSVMKADGAPYTVYTPFMRQWKTLPKPTCVLETGGRFCPLHNDPAWKPEMLWTGPLPPASEKEAQARLALFAAGPVYRYSDTRNNLTPDPFDTVETSCLSPYLRFGLLSPRHAYWAARAAYERAQNPEAQRSVEAWVNELIWREFYVHILYHFPHVDHASFRSQFDDVEWRNADSDFKAWQDGLTGYPVVDAAMRQLKTIGWIPNRARMIVASFLTKSLLIDWRRGEQHFMNWLIDGDLAANNGGWQWTAGTGTDAQPYFRIFNPVLQAQKFDPEGRYIRRWIPELRDVPAQFVHQPWKMPVPPANYPPPLVDHQVARERTIAAYRAAESRKQSPG